MQSFADVRAVLALIEPKRQLCAMPPRVAPPEIARQGSWSGSCDFSVKFIAAAYTEHPLHASCMDHE